MMQQGPIRTDWPGLLLSLALQVPFVAWLVWIPWAKIDEWAWCFVMLGPLELVRLLVLSSLARVFGENDDPTQAVKLFAARAWLLIAIFAAIMIVLAIAGLGLEKTIAVVSGSSFRAVVLIPVAALVIQNAADLHFFRGDVRIQAARLNAMASDAGTWFFLAFLTIPCAIAVLFGLALYFVPGSNVPEWLVRRVGSAFAIGVLLYPAAYYAGKALILSQVFTARFALTGQRVLGASWIAFLKSNREETVSAEQRDIAWRRAAMKQGAE